MKNILKIKFFAILFIAGMSLVTMGFLSSEAKEETKGKTFPYGITSDDNINYIVTNDKEKFSGIQNSQILPLPPTCDDESLKSDNDINLIYSEEEKSVFAFWTEGKYVCGSKYFLAKNTWDKSVILVNSPYFSGDFKVPKFEDSRIAIVYRKKVCGHHRLVGKIIDTNIMQAVRAYESTKEISSCNNQFYTENLEFPVIGFLNDSIGELHDYDIDGDSIVVEYRNPYTQNSSLWLIRLNSSKEERSHILVKRQKMLDHDIKMYNPKIISSAGGNKLLLWQSLDLGGESDLWDIFMIFLGKNLDVLQRESFTKVNSYFGGNQTEPDGFWEKGKFVVYFKSDRFESSQNKSNLVYKIFDISNMKRSSKEELAYSSNNKIIDYVSSVKSENPSPEFLVESSGYLLKFSK